MDTRTMPTTYRTLATYWPSLFSLSGGRRVYGINCTSTHVHVYLPPPVDGTEMLFVRLSAGTNRAMVLGCTKGPLQESTSLQAHLRELGSAVYVVADEEENTWRIVTPGTYIR